MSSGSNSKFCSSNFLMEGESNRLKDGALYNRSSILLEFSASDDGAAFKNEVEGRGFDIDEPSFWYGRRIGSRKMGFEERTPLMIAAMFGSIEVLKYIIETGKVDVNRACGSDGITALHCAVAGGTCTSVEVVKLLLDAAADADCVDVYGNKPIDLIPVAMKSSRASRKRTIELLLKGDHTSIEEEELEKITIPQLSKEGIEKKEYPIDTSLPDINNGIYGTDEFRMFTFKVKPCSRAYSHDWTECPFVHPGENARRRDPRKYPYSCVPCPEFRKGACPKGDACEYAHGVFESWLHPAQYRTRLCKDEIGCSRKVCFFAHKPEELRPVYAATGSAMPSPSSISVSAVDMSTLSPLSLGSTSLPLPTTSTPPMSPLAAASSPKSGNLWQNKVNLTPPALQLPGSRLKTAFSARDLDLEMELLGLESHSTNLQQQQLMDEISSLSSPSCWSKEYTRIGDLKRNLDDVFESLDPSVLSQLQGMSLKQSTPTQLQSPTGLQIRQNMNQLLAAAMMNSRSSAFAKRSQSFIDRGAVTSRAGLTTASNSSPMRSSNLSDWSSPDGKLDWGVQGDELNRLKKSASFGFRSNNLTTATTTGSIPPSSNVDEPDVSWVHSLVKDAAPARSGLFGAEKQQYNRWMDQLYIEQEQMVA
ncbi:Zinc finger CCCH domain-containing protein [Melia azedarach]|uniref:Zinc finger CCCH domain-containing protein n=2 Tax=Melia azedarach TaxID=155640 RepID=A0ACC1Y9J4_MELAZ|nr:Zinc finger CCCH domain-containing protein [Melia azedarach]KAJ4720078.1 Zinc finger CCCH domain-containing protein [Melia azedarach]